MNADTTPRTPGLEEQESEIVSATPIFASGEYLAQMCLALDEERAKVRALTAERDALRRLLTNLRTTLESAPQDALGEGSYAEMDIYGEGYEVRYPIRDEIISDINRALNAEGADHAA